MKRSAIALCAAGAAAIAIFGVIHVTGGSDTPPSSTAHDTVKDGSRSELKNQGAEQARQLKKAEEETTRRVRDYAKKHAHDKN